MAHDAKIEMLGVLSNLIGLRLPQDTFRAVLGNPKWLGSATMDYTLASFEKETSDFLTLSSCGEPGPGSVGLRQARGYQAPAQGLALPLADVSKVPVPFACQNQSSWGINIRILHNSDLREFVNFTHQPPSTEPGEPSHPAHDNTLSRKSSPRQPKYRNDPPHWHP